MRFAGIVVALPLLLLSQSGSDLDVITLNDVPCPLEGTAKSEDVKELNLLKGRYHSPVTSDVNPTVTLTSMVAPGRRRGPLRREVGRQGRGVRARSAGRRHGDV